MLKVELSDILGNKTIERLQSVTPYIVVLECDLLVIWYRFLHIYMYYLYTVFFDFILFCQERSFRQKKRKNQIPTGCK